MAQAQCVADHADRGQRHRRGGDDRRQLDAEEGVEDPGGQRDADGVVGQGEEQILPDVAHWRRQRQPP